MVEATVSFSKGMVFVREGTRLDIDDDIVKLEPGLFRRMDGSPVTPRAA